MKRESSVWWKVYAPRTLWFVQLVRCSYWFLEEIAYAAAIQNIIQAIKNLISIFLCYFVFLQQISMSIFCYYSQLKISMLHLKFLKTAEQKELQYYNTIQLQYYFVSIKLKNTSIIINFVYTSLKDNLNKNFKKIQSKVCRFATMVY